MNAKSFIAVALLLAGCATEPPPVIPLTAAEMQTLLIGNTVSGSTLKRAQFAMYFRANGRAAGELAEVTAAGTWRITSDGQFCTQFPGWDYSAWAGGREVCYRFYRSDSGYRLTEGAEVAGVVTQISPGNPRNL